MTSDTQDSSTPSPLHTLVEVWQQACDDVLALLESLDEADWSRPTDLPGWDVKAVASHLAHLESELAGMPQEQVEVEQAPHLRSVMAQYTEAGPIARREWAPSRIIDELREAVRIRSEALLADPPDLAATAPSFAALAGWSWETLLRNRPLDVWMHEQDIRAAVQRPGGLDSPAAVHVAAVFAGSLPMVLGKRAGAQPGQSVVVRLDRAPAGAPREVAVAVGEDGRAAPVETPREPTATIELGFGDWLRLCGGRCEPTTREISVSGDRDLADRVVQGLAVTP